jgi:hypothetical protein
MGREPNLSEGDALEVAARGQIFWEIFEDASSFISF